MSSTIIDTIYTIETLMKVAFLPMALLNLRYTYLLAILISLIGALRILKLPQLNKQYLLRLLTNNHGQSLLYLIMCGLGPTNYLFYAPLTLYYLYALVEYVQLKYPGSRFQSSIDRVRNLKYYIMEGRVKLEIAFFAFLIVTLPLDFVMRLLKVFLLAQYLLLKFRVSSQCRTAFAAINATVESVLQFVPFVHRLYCKLTSIVYGYAAGN